MFIFAGKQMIMMMKKETCREALFPECPIRNVIARIGEKWSLLVIYTLEQQPNIRFNALQRMIPDISQKMLTQTLRTLEEDGLVCRTVYAEVPPRVEYTLTARAESLVPHLNGLISWAQANLDAIIYDRMKHQNAI